MKTALTAIVAIALGALLFAVPMAGAAGGDGTGPDGKGCPMMKNGGQGTGQMVNGQGKGMGMGKGMGCGRCGKMGQGRMMNGQGRGFVDANGDGVCDHYATAMKNGGKGKGQMMNGQGTGFVDADGNGICDHHPANGTTKKAAE